MKKILIKLIKFYQRLPLNCHKSCKYIPTCSNYALLVLNDYNLFYSLFLIIKRILKCNPFTKGGIDLPPRKAFYEKN